MSDPNAPTTGQVQQGGTPAPSPTPYVAAGAGTPFDVYQSLHNGYLGPLQQQPTPAPLQLDDPTLQAIANQLSALQETHPVINGATPPSTDSVIARQTSHLSAGQVATEVGKETWQQMVMQPLQDFIHTWQTDPKAGLMETLGGAALVGGLIGLEALTGGAATPFIFAASAALIAPSLIQSWGDELHNPTDANLVKALVATSTGLLTVGVPLKWAKGLQLSRQSLAFALRAKKDMTAVEETIPEILSGNAANRRFIDPKTPIENQLHTLPDDAEKARQMLLEDGVNIKDRKVGDLLKRLGALNGLQKAYRATTDPKKKAELKAQIMKYAKEDVLPLQKSVAAHYLYLPQSKFSHIPLGPTEKTAELAKDIQLAMAKAGGEIIGYIEQIGFGHPGLTSDQLSGASIVEQAGRDMQAGGSSYYIGQMQRAHEDIVKKLGLDDEQIKKVEIGMEDPKKWNDLTGRQQLYGQFRSQMHNAMTLAELRNGTIPLALAGYVPRMFAGVEDVKHTNGVRSLLDSLRGAMISRSRVWDASFDAMSGDISYTERTRQQILDAEDLAGSVYKAQQPLRDYYATNATEIDKLRNQVGRATYWYNRFKREGNDKKAAEQFAKRELMYTEAALKGQKHADLVRMTGDQLDRLKKIAPLGRKLVTGTDLFNASTASYVYRMEEAALRAAAETHANLAISDLQKLFLKMPLAKYGISIQSPEFRASHVLPDFLPESAFRGGAEAARGYKQVFRAIGRPGDLHYRPGLYARDELADELHGLMQGASSGAEAYAGLFGVLYKAVTGSKRVIMATPFWHAMNVTGRAIAFLLDDPVGASTALSTVWGKGEFLLNPEEKAKLLTRFSQAGGVHANRFNVTNHMHRALRNADAQASWPQGLRTMYGFFGHAYGDMLEGGFWKTVNDFQLAAFQLAEHRFKLKLPNEPEAEISRLAAEYANNLGGMVNPLYMNRVYKYMRNFIWFAPSYWATFARALLSFPFADRISGGLAAFRGGEFVRLSNLPLKAVSEAGRREYTRAMRSWTLTYLATGVVAADMLNVLLGGRHIWENDPGHMFDVNVDNFAEWSKPLNPLSPGGPQQTPAGATRHTYWSAVPFFRQTADVMNALGLGHDWGLAHQFSDQTWQQANVLQKIMMAAGGIADGARREAANKIGGVPQAVYGAATGEELSARLGTGTQRQLKGPIGSLSALLNLVPGGMSLERFWSQEASTAQQFPVGSPQWQQAQQQAAQGAAQSIPSALVQQFTGLPSMYHMGPEQAPVDDSKMQNWYTERNQLHDALQNASKEVFMGQMQPLAYERKKQQVMDRLIQLDVDTFGNTSPAAPLMKARQELSQQLGLDNLGLSDAEWFARYTQFNNAWDQVLQAASPETRAAWWQTEHSQWTDADYLSWEAKELKKAVAAAVDGQGGHYIQAYENQISQLEALPLTTAERQKIEESDPYYYTYRQVIQSMSRSSALGAFINAFTSPYSETYIMPQGLTPDQQQQMAQAAPGTASLVSPETATQLAAQARALAGSQEVTQAGGDATQSPEFEQTVQQLASEAGVG